MGTGANSRQDCVPGTGVCLHLMLSRASMVNTLQAQSSEGAPLDFGVCYAGFVPGHPVVTSVVGRSQPTPRQDSRERGRGTL